jgi:hypothetical protein
VKEHADAFAMIDTFASVGTTRFDVTFTTRSGDKDWFRRGMRLADLRHGIPDMLDAAVKCERNVIVRPHGAGRTFVQLDDLKAEKLAALAPAVFLALETSPPRGNFQAWVALEGGEDKDFARRLRKGTGADATASGATRVAGSVNFKDKYAPDFPRVALHQVNAGRIATIGELERLGLVSPPEIVSKPLSPPRSRPGPGARKWPSYARCLDGAPLNSEENGPDVSRADFVWCMTAVTWGWSIDETAERLAEESAKARQNGRAYVELTVRNAALAVERRDRQPTRQPIVGNDRR